MQVENLLDRSTIKSRLKQTPRQINTHRIDVQLIEADFMLSYRVRPNFKELEITGEIYAKLLLDDDSEYVKVFAPVQASDFLPVWTLFDHLIYEKERDERKATCEEVYSLVGKYK